MGEPEGTGDKKSPPGVGWAVGVEIGSEADWSGLAGGAAGAGVDWEGVGGEEKMQVWGERAWGRRM